MNVSQASPPHLSTGDFLDSVLRLRPQVAAFDCDGTLWSGDAGESFFDWEIRARIVPQELGRAMRARYAEYKAGKVGEEDMCGEMVTMHAGMTESRLMELAAEFFEDVFPGKIFPEMRDLVARLQETGCEVWAVSSSNEWVIRAGMKQFAIAQDRILAAKVEVDGDVITERLVRVPSGPGKPKALREVAQNEVDAAFGNSRWDTEMLKAAKHPFAVNPNPDLEATARHHGWTIYFPNATRRP